MKGAVHQFRPSASYYYKTLNKPVGFKISYRPRKGGKYILHELAIRQNGSPYWKALEKLPKKQKGGNVLAGVGAAALIAGVGFGAYKGYKYLENKDKEKLDRPGTVITETKIETPP